MHKVVGGKEHFRDIGVDWRIILKWTIKKQGGWLWGALIRVRLGSNGRHEHDNEPWGFIKDEEFLN
jgi:hypothetical protein